MLINKEINAQIQKESQGKEYIKEGRKRKERERREEREDLGCTPNKKNPRRRK